MNKIIFRGRTIPGYRNPEWLAGDKKIIGPSVYIIMSLYAFSSQFEWPDNTFNNHLYVNNASPAEKS